MRYDIVVCGGGLSGVCAAIAAARGNKRVLLIEKYGVLGGAALHALVNPFMAYKTKSHRVNNAGLFQSILEGLTDMGARTNGGSTFNEQLLSMLLDRMLLESGAEVLFHAQLMEAKTDGGVIQSVTALGMSAERIAIEADVFIDATGDAELTYLSGCPFAVGRPEDGACQPMTTCFRVGNVDMERLRTDAEAAGYKNIAQYLTGPYNDAQKSGGITNPRENVLLFPTLLPGMIHFNSTRVIGRSSLDTRSFTQAEIEGRRQALELYLFFKKTFPAFADSVLVQSAPQIGVRESRRLRGAYTLTCEDVLSCVRFPDAVARGCYDIDVHNPTGTGTLIRHLPPDSYYTIPMRSLYNASFPNLTVAGRPISSDHAAHSSLRVMPICSSVGEAAGTLAALACTCGVAGVSAGAVQEKLAKYGAAF